MTYKEAIEILKRNKPTSDPRLCGKELCTACDVAIEALEKTMWIPCSERLPDKNGNYLVTVSSYDETASIEFVCIDHCNSDGKFLHYENRKPKRKTGEYVVAWMPAHEPYKAGEQE